MKITNNSGTNVKNIKADGNGAVASINSIGWGKSDDKKNNPANKTKKNKAPIHFSDIGKDESDEVNDSSESNDDEKISSTVAKFKQNTSDYSFTCEGSFVYVIYAYCIQKWINENADSYMVIDDVLTMEMQTDYDSYENILTTATIAFSWKGNLYEYKTVSRDLYNSLSSRKNVEPLVKILKKYIKEHNPLHGKNIYLTQTGMLMKKVGNIGFEDVILDEKMKADIYDNVIYQLKELDDNNGVIFYGLPGTGKTLLTSAIINVANKDNFTTCYITSKIDFAQLEEFVYKFLSPCIIIFEDIDSMGQSREQTLNTDISTLLQFISGIAEKSDKIIFIATTNYIEHLDKAIANRPMRFNRRYEFKLPNDNEINQLVDLYFGEFNLPKEFYALCYSKKFTGSHIKEIRRTCNLTALRQKGVINSETICEVFPNSVQIIRDNFKTLNEDKSFGFNHK